MEPPFETYPDFLLLTNYRPRLFNVLMRPRQVETVKMEFAVADSEEDDLH